MDNIPSFAARKHKREEVALLHPMMEPILRETYGIIVYQEQVMQIARTLAGYSLGEADLLRRAMGKKIHAEMVAQKERFAEGAETERHPQGHGERDLRPGAEVRQLRLQQVARRGLCAGQLSDGLAEGALPGRILRRLDGL